jgi:8-oxo-dGTP pyrophosphatase MutT (NUDIX family)
MEAEKHFFKQFEEFSRKLPHFPDGRIDYHNSQKALVLNCFVTYKDRVLLLKRGDKVAAYKNKWNSVGGYLDEQKPIAEKIKQELQEELGIRPGNILKIRICDPFEVHDKEINKIWVVYPCIAELNEMQDIVLDWEHTDYRWIRPTDITEFDVVKDLEKTLQRVLQ